MSNIPSRIPVLRVRRETFVSESQKVTTTAKPPKEVPNGVPLSKSTTGQQFQSTQKKNKAITTTKTTAKEMKSKDIPFSKSTTAQQPQSIPEDKIIISKDLARRVGVLLDEQQALERDLLQIVSEGLREPEDRSERWQTINLALHALATFTWMHISDVDKEELRENGMNNFLDITYVKKGERGQARDVATRIYDTIHEDLTYMAAEMMSAKRVASHSRNPLARPDITDAAVCEFLKVEFGSELPDCSPLEMGAFKFIKATVNTDANIQEANRDP